MRGFLNCQKAGFRLQRLTSSIMSTFLQCDAPVRGDKMTKLEKVATRHKGNFMGGLLLFAPLQEQFAENANKS